MEELQKMKKAGEGTAACFGAEYEMETAVMEMRVSEMKGEGTIGEDMFDRVRNDRVV